MFGTARIHFFFLLIDDLYSSITSWDLIKANDLLVGMLGTEFRHYLPFVWPNFAMLKPVNNTFYKRKRTIFLNCNKETS